MRWALALLIAFLAGYAAGRWVGVRVGLERRMSMALPASWLATRRRRRELARGMAKSLIQRNRP
jgi:hypothetical protein